MNCDILKIVRGNDFATQMTITALDAGGNVIEDFSLEDSTELVVKYTLAGNLHTIEAYDYDIEGNDITIQWSDLALGKYGFEIEGKFNGYSWRSAARFIFQIVADNASANIPDGVLVDGVYKLSDWLRLLSGTGGGGNQVQADWDETDTNSPAYIQNKPNLSPVATSGSYNDLTDKPTIPDVSGKADKVSGAVAGDFAGLDANGNIIDSGKKASDFATAAQGAKADTAIQDISGKQDVLVSGTNIKTINNESILGSGNITIEGGGDVDSVNGKTGVVVLDAEDVGALPDDTPIPEELTTVNVSVDGNVGTPSGSATISGNTISFEFSNLKGSTGQQGPKGDTVILGEGEEYTLYNVTGQNTDGAMTQQAATNNFPVINDAYSLSYDLAVADENGYAIALFDEGNIKTKNFNSKFVPSTESEYAGADFCITDENGNAIVLFEGGNVKTKKFNSAPFIDFDWLRGKRVAIMGDSISTNGNTGVDSNVPELIVSSSDVGVELSAYLTYYDVQAGLSLGGHTFTSSEIGTEVTFTPLLDDVGKSIGLPNNYNPNAVTTWWEHAASILGFSAIPVCWSGSSITSHDMLNSYNTGSNAHKMDCSYAWHESQIRKCGIRQNGSMTRIAPNVIIIYRGTNDFSHSSNVLLTGILDNDTLSFPNTDLLDGGLYGYVEGFAITIKKLRESYPTAKIVLCTLNTFKRVNCSSFPINNGHNTLPQWNDKIREIADYFGCGIIDFDKDGITFENCYPTYISDSSTNPTHPNDNGHRLMGIKAIKDLITL